MKPAHVHMSETRRFIRSALILGAIILVAALLVRVGEAAQPAFTGAPRAHDVWLTSDPLGFDQLKYLAGRDILLDTLAAFDRVTTNNMWALYIAETNRAQVAEAVLRTNWVAQVVAETNRARIAEGALASAISPVTNALVLFAGGFLKSDGTNVFYISRDFVYTNALTTNSP